MPTPAERLAALPLPPAVKKLLPERKGVIAVVRLQGVIAASGGPLARGVINAEAVEPALKRAFETDGLTAVALAINSPGGSPTQSALVADRIRGLASEKGVRVIAFCEDLAASGGYWLACAADEIIAHPTSLVGSIGVISGGFGLEGLADKLGVERRVYTAGKSKARLDPFKPEKPEDVAWLRSLQDELHGQFIDWVKERRGAKLQSDELFDGEVWTGTRAAELGLVDGLGTLRGVIEERYPKAEIVGIDARRGLLGRLGVGLEADQVLTALERRALWSRFGL